VTAGRLEREEAEVCFREEVAGPGLEGYGAATFLQSWREIPGIGWALFVVRAVFIYFIFLFSQIVHS